MGKRTKARECALQMLYQWDITREPMDRVADFFWQRADELRTRRGPWPSGWPAGPRRDVARLDEAITRGQPTNWRFDRIAAVDKNILRLAAYELTAASRDAVFGRDRRGGGAGQALQRGGLAVRS